MVIPALKLANKLLHRPHADNLHTDIGSPQKCSSGGILLRATYNIDSASICGLNQYRQRPLSLQTHMRYGFAVIRYIIYKYEETKS